MFEHVKDFWELVVFLFVGVLGLGEARYRLFQTQADLKEVQSAGYCTTEQCHTTQEACKDLQCLKHSQYKENTDKLTGLIEHVGARSDEHYEKMIDRMDSNNKQLIELIGKLK